MPMQERWTARQLKQARDMLDAGRTYLEVGRAVGFSDRAVHEALKRHGMLPPPRRGRRKSER